ncbi:helix-turn-helix transcriptional regulator [Candidatus Calescamantes bacterium]|nr:helix-turn-helix transcriptional regulator [Candidatus Calescamantes bacterium]
MTILKVARHSEGRWRGFPRHIHEEVWQIDYFSSGKGRFWMEDHWERVEDNSIFFIPPGREHEFESYPEALIDNFSIKFSLSREEISKFSLPEKVVKLCSEEKREDLSLLLRNIVGYHTLRNYFLAEKNLRLLLAILRDIKRPFSTLRDKVDYVRELIENNYSLPLKLSWMAEKVGLNPHYLSRVYKHITGENIFKYLQRIRMEKSRELLLSTDEPLKKIASLCGFSNVFYFSLSFKNYFGIPPGKMRKKLA